MKHVLTGEEALKVFNKDAKNNLSKLEQEEFNKKIHQVAQEMRLVIEKCDLESLPDFVQESNSRLYTNELDKAPESSPNQPEDNNKKNKFFKDIYKVTCEDGSLFFVMQNGLGMRMVSDNWTKESIDKCAEMAAKLGGKAHMIPSGEPGAFPDHLREYARKAFAKHGIDLPDPTPPTPEKIKLSMEKYGVAPSIQLSSMKDELATMRTKEPTMPGLSPLPDSEERAENTAGITPFSTTPKPH